jgi:hypothetical protein
MKRAFETVEDNAKYEKMYETGLARPEQTVLCFPGPGTIRR